MAEKIPLAMLTDAYLRCLEIERHREWLKRQPKEILADDPFSIVGQTVIRN